MGICSLNVETRPAVHVWLRTCRDAERFRKRYGKAHFDRADFRLLSDPDLGFHHLRGDTASVCTLVWTTFLADADDAG